MTGSAWPAGPRRRRSSPPTGERKGRTTHGLLDDRSLKSLTVRLEETLFLPQGGHVTHPARRGARATDLVHIVQTQGVQQILLVSKVGGTVRMQMRFAEQARSITEFPDLAHPGVGVGRYGIRDVTPDTVVVRVGAGCQRHPRRHAKRRRRDAIAEAHALGGDSIQIRRVDPATAATHRVPALLIGHQKENVVHGSHALTIVNLTATRNS